MKKLLVVEDDNLIGENIKEYFEINDFIVKLATNGTEALEILQVFKPDVIISDMMMPLLDGNLLLEKIRENKSTSLIPFVMLTARVDTADKRNVMNLGADDYITKPFNFKDLFDAVNSQIKKNSQVKKHIVEESLSSLQHWRNVANHEIFTTLNVLQNIINVIKIETPIDTEIENIFNLSLRRLKKTLNKLMLISGVQELNNNFTHYKSTFINKFIDDTINDCFRLYNKKVNIQKNINLPDEFFCREYVLLVLSELIENSFKFCDNNTDINIAIGIINSNVIIEIDNCSSNIPSDFTLNNKPFYQPDRIVTEQQGLGLGLYLINTLVNKYKDNLVLDINNNIVKYTWTCISNH